MNREEYLAYMREYRKTHKEEISKKQKEWYERNKEVVIGRSKNRYENNKEQIKEQLKEYRKNNVEEIKNRQKEWYNNNKQKANAQSKLWRYNNKEKERAHNLLKNYIIEDETHHRGECTLTQKWIMDNIFSSNCIYCGDSNWRHLGCDRIDNSKPHTPDNVVCSCGICNVERGDRYTIEEFVEHRKTHPRDDEPQKLQEVVEINGIRVIRKVL